MEIDSKSDKIKRAFREIATAFDKMLIPLSLAETKSLNWTGFQA